MAESHPQPGVQIQLFSLIYLFSFFFFFNNFFQLEIHGRVVRVCCLCREKQTIDLSESPCMSDFTGRGETDGSGGGKSGSDH